MNLRISEAFCLRSVKNVADFVSTGLFDTVFCGFYGYNHLKTITVSC